MGQIAAPRPLAMKPVRPPDSRVRWAGLGTQDGSCSVQGTSASNLTSRDVDVSHVVSDTPRRGNSSTADGWSLPTVRAWRSSAGARTGAAGDGTAAGADQGVRGSLWRTYTPPGPSGTPRWSTIAFSISSRCSCSTDRPSPARHDAAVDAVEPRRMEQHEVVVEVVGERETCLSTHPRPLVTSCRRSPGRGRSPTRGPPDDDHRDDEAAVTLVTVPPVQRRSRLRGLRLREPGGSALDRRRAAPGPDRRPADASWPRPRVPRPGRPAGGAGGSRHRGLERRTGTIGIMNGAAGRRPGRTCTAQTRRTRRPRRRRSERRRSRAPSRRHRRPRDGNSETSRSWRCTYLRLHGRTDPAHRPGSGSTNVGTLEMACRTPRVRWFRRSFTAVTGAWIRQRRDG